MKGMMKEKQGYWVGGTVTGRSLGATVRSHHDPWSRLRNTTQREPAETE